MSEIIANLISAGESKDAEAFIDACRVGDQNEVKSLVKQDPGIINKPDSQTGRMGLMLLLQKGHHSLTRLLLSLPGIKSNHLAESTFTALHIASIDGHPLDIVITLAKLSNWNTVNVNQYQNLTA